MHQRPVHNVIVDFFADEPTPQAIEAMEAWLREDAANIKTLAEFLMLDGLLLSDQKSTDAAAILNGLLDAEQQAPLVLVDVAPDSRPARRAHRPDEPSLSARQLLSLAGYLVMQGLRQPAMIKTAVAAVLLLSAALILVVTLSGPTQPSADPPHGHATTQGQSEAKTQASAVATLTATHNTAWAEGELARGSVFLPGDRLTLTAGLAEITTRRGAVLTLHGPCQIDFTDHDNALRLNRGTLFADVPPAATGFTIDTPTARIIDIGTQFGVRVAATQITRLQVYKGKVSIAPASDGNPGPQTTLLAGQAAQAHAGQVTLVPYTNRARFARDFAQQQAGRSWIASYRFDQPNQPVLRESRGEAMFDAQIVGATWTQGRAPGSHALNFTGKGWDERVVLSQGASDRLALQGDFTIALWFSIRSCPDKDWAPLVTKGNDCWRILASRRGKDKKLTVGFYNTVDQSNILSWDAVRSGEIVPDQWYHLVVTGQADDDPGDGVRARLFIDGELVDEGRLSRIRTNDWPVVFGANASITAQSGFDGRLSEIEFLSHAISEGEALERYNTGSSPKLDPG